VSSLYVNVIFFIQESQPFLHHAGDALDCSGPLQLGVGAEESTTESSEDADKENLGNLVIPKTGFDFLDDW
jgi:hypothetical protein